MENKDILVYCILGLMIICVLISLNSVNKRLCKLEGSSSSNTTSNTTTNSSSLLKSEKFSTTENYKTPDYDSNSFDKSGPTKLTTIDADGNLNTYEFPPGIIVAWAGPSNSIPDGWKLCDGSNGTPNLTGRFIIGAGGKYSPGNSGGSEKLAPHTHRYFDAHFGESNGGDFPDYRTRTNLAEGDAQATVSDKKRSYIGGSARSDGDNTAFGYMRDTLEQSEYVDRTVTKDDGSSTANAMPPYFALCFIMKEK